MIWMKKRKCLQLNKLTILWSFSLLLYCITKRSNWLSMKTRWSEASEVWFHSSQSLLWSLLSIYKNCLKMCLFYRWIPLSCWNTVFVCVVQLHQAAAEVNLEWLIIVLEGGVRGAWFPFNHCKDLILDRHKRTLFVGGKPVRPLPLLVLVV